MVLEFLTLRLGNGLAARGQADDRRNPVRVIVHCAVTARGALPTTGCMTTMVTLKVSGHPGQGRGTGGGTDRSLPQFFPTRSTA